MKIVVVAVAAESGGALSILNEVHAAALADSSVRWTFVTSLPELIPSPHVRVSRCPWAKRSWAHRIWFDHIVLPKLLAAESPDVVLSLHNVPVKGTAARQVVYLQQALPFSEYKFRLLRDPKRWLYQKAVGYRINRGLQKRADFIVQTEWMHKAVSARRGRHLGRVKTISPRPTVGPYVRDDNEELLVEELPRFFYPAGALPYKNHSIIVDAIKVLESNVISDFEMVLTLTAEDFQELRLGIPSPRIRLVGRLSYDQVMAEYRNSTLIFPSLIETVGLPLLEAMMSGARIIAADRPYAREQVEGYEGAFFVDPTDAIEMASAMQMSLASKKPGSIKPWLLSRESSWREVITFLKDEASNV